MKPVHECTAEELIAEAKRRDANRRAGRPLDYVSPDVRTAAELAVDEARLEKAHVRAADKQLRTLGFRVINTSQPRHAKYITPGVPDRIYFHRTRGLGLLWEAKADTGRQSTAQRDFMLDCQACGWPYVLGTDQDLFAWLVERRVAVRDASGNLVTPPSPPSGAHR